VTGGRRAPRVRDGFNTIALLSVAVAAVGYTLVRPRDFVAGGGPAATPPEPEPARA